MERDGLFWREDGTAVLLLLRVLVGCGGVVLAFMLQVQSRSYLAMAPWWGAACGVQDALIRSTLSLFSFMASQLVGSCLLFLVVLSLVRFIARSENAIAIAIAIAVSFIARSLFSCGVAF